jgi:hypothetical protein
MSHKSTNVHEQAALHVGMVWLLSEAGFQDQQRGSCVMDKLHILTESRMRDCPEYLQVAPWETSSQRAHHTVYCPWHKCLTSDIGLRHTFSPLRVPWDSWSSCMYYYDGSQSAHRFQAQTSDTSPSHCVSIDLSRVNKHRQLEISPAVPGCGSTADTH